VQAVGQRLLDERMIRDLALAGQVLGAGELLRKHHRDQVVGRHALQRRRRALAALVAADREGDACVPAPAGREERRVEHGLHEHVRDRCTVEKARDAVELETVRLTQRQHDRVLRGGRLQLEVERAAEALAQGEPEGAVDPCAERRVDDELHSAGFVEEALEHQRSDRRQTAQHGLGGCKIFDELLRRHTVDAETLHGVIDGSSDSLAGHLGQQRLDGFPQPRHCRGELARAGRRLAEPERDTGRLTLGVLHPDTARLDAQDAVRGVTKLEDVALEALDREILVECSDERPGRLEDHLVVRVVGDGAATGDGGQPGATPRPQPVVHRVTVQIGAASPAPSADALGEHPHDVIEVLARQLPVRPCAGDEGEQLVLAIFARRHFGHDLLRQHVERVRRDAQLIELLAAHRIQQRDRFNQLVTARREQPALRHAADRVIGTTHPLQEHRDGARRPQLTDELHVAYVDAELERGGGDHSLEPARLETLLGVEALLLGQTAMVSRDVLLADALGEMPRHPLHHASRIREYERGVMLRDEAGKLVIDGRPDVPRHHRFERGARHHDRKVAFAHMTAVDDLAGDVGPGAGQEARDLLDRLLCGRQPDALHGLCRQGVEPLQRQREMRAALGARDRMDLVDDHRARGRQHPATGLAGEQQVQRLGCGHEDMRRQPSHRCALRLRGVAGANLGADLACRHAEPRELRTDPGQRLLEIALDVVRQRLERRHVHHARRILEPALDTLVHERIDCRQKRRQCLARSRRGGDQRMPAACDRGPGGGLRRRRGSEGRVEPGLDGRMESRRGHGVRVYRRAVSEFLHSTRKAGQPPEAGRAGGRTVVFSYATERGHAQEDDARS
jgi:hypothetical protein